MAKCSHIWTGTTQYADLVRTVVWWWLMSEPLFSDFTLTVLNRSFVSFLLSPGDQRGVYQLLLRSECLYWQRRVLYYHDEARLEALKNTNCSCYSHVCMSDWSKHDDWKLVCCHFFFFFFWLFGIFTGHRHKSSQVLIKYNEATNENQYTFLETLSAVVVRRT